MLAIQVHEASKADDGANFGALPTTVGQQLNASNFKGKAKQFRLLYNAEGSSEPLLGVVGLGKKAANTNKAADAIRLAASTAVGSLHALDAKSAKSIKFDGLGDPKAAGEGAVLATYSFNHFKGEDAQTGSVETFVEGSEDVAAQWRLGASIAEAQNHARKLAETPANLMTPTIFADTAKQLLSHLNNPNVTVNVHDHDWVVKQKMGAFLSVGRGSEEPLKFLEIIYSGGAKAETYVGLVGKGVTFDTGGISIKPSTDMAMMKGDMGGAAAVLGAMWGIAKLRVPANVVAVIPLTENMPSGRATKPGDVVWARNGKSIEVDNTDAEGRLILADAINYVSTTHRVSQIVELSTLTGAMDVALGSVFAGVFTTSDILWKELEEAGEKAGDPFWRMPLDDRYHEQIKSDVADLKNVGGRSAGSCTAAIFLKNFLGPNDKNAKKVPFAHIDIAGVMHNRGPSGYLSKGMTGRPTRSIIELVRNLAETRSHESGSGPTKAPQGAKPVLLKTQTRAFSTSQPNLMPRGKYAELLAQRPKPGQELFPEPVPEPQPPRERRSVESPDNQRSDRSARSDEERSETESSSQPTVRIKREKIAGLAGWEKMDLFRDFVKAGQTEDALYTLEIIKNNTLLPRLRYQDFHILIHLLIREPLVYRTQILEAFDNVREFGHIPTQAIYNVLIKCCTKWGDLDFAQQLYDEMLSHNFKPTTETYTDLIALCSRQRGVAGWRKGVGFWKQMHEEGLRPVRSTYTRAMEIHGKLKLVNELKEVHSAALEYLHRYGQSISIETLLRRQKEGGKLTTRQEGQLEKARQMEIAFGNAYMSALGNCGAHEDVLAVFAQMCASGGPHAGEKRPSNRIMEGLLNILLKAHQGLGDAEGAEKLWKEMMQRGTIPDVVAYGRMVAISGRAGDLKRAKEWMEEGVERLRVAPGSSKMLKLRNSLLIGYAENGEVEEAMKLVRVMQADIERRKDSDAKKADQKPGRPAPKLLRSGLQALIDAYVKAGNLPGALAVWDLMPEQKIRTQSVENDSNADVEGSEDAAGGDEGGEVVEGGKLTKEDIISRFYKLHPNQQAVPDV
ncbi:bleomycin hydrolase [Rhizophlyctis rosea]|uniref:Bleomycin hydrolase n=1 Tax=Rhizophlyctis rosea TaxID=64517 RepID=A0AAD5SK55_9FUNG|nr:bleomycin hydrolase [Rhizophlyctis rosea]